MMSRFALKLSLAVTAALSCSLSDFSVAGEAGAKAPEEPRRKLVETAPRGGLPNFYAKLRVGQPVKIGYLGGSITAQPGWRVFSREYFQKRFPDAKVTEINAAIGGTGSNLGAFRVQSDVLRHRPDLMFVEFAVNDASTAPEQIRLTMEGIVRQTWKALPDTDICFVYTLVDGNVPELSKGVMQRSASAMEDVADFYQIPSVHLGVEIVDLAKRGEVVMKAGDEGLTRVSGEELDALSQAGRTPDGKIPFSKDGVHPYPNTGHRLYMAALARALPVIEKAGQPGGHALAAPMSAANWENARVYPLSKAKLTGFEQMSAKEGLGKTFGARLPEVWHGKPGAEMTFRFKGTKVEIYDVLGPDSGQLSVQVDDGPAKEVKRMDSYCTYHRLGMLNVAGGLPDAEHQVTIKVLDKSFDKTALLKTRGNNAEDIEKNPKKYEGLNWYAGAIMVLGELVD